MPEDIFKTVTTDDKTTILQLLRNEWPRNFILHQYISLIDFNKKHISQVLYRSGNIIDGVYLVETKFSEYSDTLIVYFIFTLSKDPSNLYTSLLETKIIPWNTGKFIFEITMSRFTPKVGMAFVTKGVKAAVQHYQLLWLPPDVQVDCVEPSDDVHIDLLNKNHVSEVVKNWPSFPGHETIILKEILLNGGYGIFRKSDKRLISSALHFHSGGIFMLYTDPQFRRKGFGEIIVRHIIGRIRRESRLPFCTVSSDNLQSKNLLKKIGFIEVDKTDFIFPAQLLQKI